LSCEVLSGKLPVDVRDKPLIEALREIQHHEPRKLGALDRRLHGDLEIVVATALEKDPVRRYPSAAALADDLRRSLRDEPIAARPATMFYQLHKFARRRKGPVVAAGIIAAALLFASFLSVIFAVHAQHQRALAEQRLGDVRQLANTMLFDLHDLIEPLPGAIEARRRLVATGLEYLNRLAATAGDNPELLEELAEAYFRIGDIQGNPNRANLGDPEAAIASYQHSIKLRERLVETEPSEASMIVLARTQLAIGEALTSTPRAGESVDYVRGCLETLDGIVAADADNVRVMAEQRLGATMLNIGRADDAIDHFQRALDASERLAADGDPVFVRRLAIGLNGMGLTLARLGRPKDAIPYLERSLKLRIAVAEKNPGSLRAQRDLALVRHRVGDVRGDLGEKEAAVEIYAKARNTLFTIAQADSNDARASFDWSVAEEKLANALLEIDRVADAREGYAAARDVRTDLADENPTNQLYRMAAAIAIERVSHCARLLSEHAEARSGYQQAMNIARDGVAKDPSDVRLWTVLGISQKGMGQSYLDAADADHAEARRWLAEARVSLQDMTARGVTPTRLTLSFVAIDELLARCE